MLQPASPDGSPRSEAQCQVDSDYVEMRGSKMAEEDNVSVDYLRALKHSDGSVAATAAAPAREPAPEEQALTEAKGNFNPRIPGTEKRRSPRHRCAGSADLREDGHEVRTWATFSDVSLHGCYVEAQATYPVGTILHMKLEANGVRVESKGTVRVNYPYLGMGIAFLEMSEANSLQLRELLSRIPRRTVVMGPRTASGIPSAGPLEAVPLITDPIAAVLALTKFFEDRQMLMREDFLRILRKSQPSEHKP